MNGSSSLCNVAGVTVVTGPRMAKTRDDVVTKNGYNRCKMAATEKCEKSSTARIARDCAYDLIHHVTGMKTEKLKPINTKYTKTMRRTVGEISDRHQIFLESAMRKLEITEETAQATIDNVANEMFVDQNFNWGRLVTLYSFCGKVAKHCANKYKSTSLVEKIADYTADYVAESLSSRIEKCGGWDAFVDYFPEPDNLENTVWKGLICTVLGLGALATMVAAR